MSIIFRPLNTIHELMNQIGYEPGYVYDDLVFSNDAVFIIQFDKNSPGKVDLFINRDCIKSESDRIKEVFTIKALQKNIEVSYKGLFQLSSKEDTEEIDIAFY